MTLVRELVTDATTGETTERMVDMPGVLSVEEAQALEVAQLADAVRAERDRRLTDCDWSMLMDAPVTDAQRTAWKAYRQALRDVPTQPGFPDAINWPVAP